MLRLGLCCLFREVDIQFRRTTAKYLRAQPRKRRLQYLSEICLHNGQALLASLQFCLQKGIGDFRINSQILPLKTHPEFKYEIEELPDYKRIGAIFSVPPFTRTSLFCCLRRIQRSPHARLQI
jgi:UV DNA damage endonuclease